MVVEAHSVCGGCAHSFTRKAPDGGQYLFDSGPSIITEMSASNPLQLVLDYVDASGDVEWIHYDGWGMLCPEGEWKFVLGPDDFKTKVLPSHGEHCAAELDAVLEACRPLAQIGRQIPGLVLRDDDWQLLPLLLKFPTGLPPIFAGGAAELSEPFSKVLEQLAEEGKLRRDSWLWKWLDALAFSISGLDCTGTTAAAMAFTVDELHRPGVKGLAYPKGGMGEVIEALAKAVRRHGGTIRTGTRVGEILVEGNRAVGVRLASGAVLRASDAVVSNATVWDTAKLLPGAAHHQGASATESPPAASFAGLREDWGETPMTRSYLHLHVGLDAEGLDLSKLQPHYTAMASWEDVTAEMNMVAISNPALLDPSLCPPGKLVFHLYCAGNEPYDIWEAAQAEGKQAYEALKEQRAERLWKALEELIPDARSRAEVALIGSPATHKRFLRRVSGTYGAAPVFGRFGPGKVPFRTARDAVLGREPGEGIEGLMVCGDSTFPGIGVPAAAVSGLSAAHSTMSVWEHLELLGQAGY